MCHGLTHSLTDMSRTHSLRDRCVTEWIHFVTNVSRSGFTSSQLCHGVDSLRDSCVTDWIHFVTVVSRTGSQWVCDTHLSGNNSGRSLRRGRNARGLSLVFCLFQTQNKTKSPYIALNKSLNFYFIPSLSLVVRP